MTINPTDLPPPATAFSADAVLVQMVPSHRCVNLWFIGAGPSLSNVRALVRARFPQQMLREQLARDAEFRRSLAAFAAPTLASGTWQPTLADLDRVEDSRIAMLEGSFLFLAFHEDAALCDIYQVPPDLMVGIENRVARGVLAQLRVNLPSLVLCRMLLDLDQALDAPEVRPP